MGVAGYPRFTPLSTVDDHSLAEGRCFQPIHKALGLDDTCCLLVSSHQDGYAVVKELLSLPLIPHALWHGFKRTNRTITST